MAARKKAYTPRHSSEDATPGAHKPAVKADAPGKPGTGGGPGTARRRGPQHGSGQTKVSGAAATSQRKRKTDALVDAADRYSHRAALRAGTGPPSITGRAAAGAAAGTATGAALGGPPGAAVGAVLGGTGGALAGRKAKKAYKMATASNLGARRIIVMEFMICAVVAALTPLTDARKEEPPGAWMKRMTAIMGLFFILGLVSSAGRGPARIAAGFGGLVTVALAISNRSLFMKVGSIFGTADEPAGPAELAEAGLTDPVDVLQPGQGRDRPGNGT